MNSVRVRFAPSPTGYLHIGGVRAALYAWLYARQQQGAFVLRIEDTDVERSTDESVQAIYDSLDWLGLDCDEGPRIGGSHGPYRQSERLAIYREHAERLIDSGHAYRCYATKEELAAAREEHERLTGAAHGFRFQSPWRDRSDGNPDAPHVVRFRAPSEGKVAWNDLVKGPIEVANETHQDFVLLRGGGMPLYNFSCVVDDMLMGINLVTRGEDHVVNTAPQILLYEALGATPPTFAHMPVVLGPGGKKLSKRDAAVGVLEYRDLGYLPDSVLNYLVRLGWSHGDQEIFTRSELIEKFDWAHVGTKSAHYDAKKFLHVNAEHLRMLDDQDLAERVVPFLVARGVPTDGVTRSLLAAMPHLKPRAETLIELAEAADYFVRSEPVFDEKGKRKFLIAENARYLRSLADLLDNTNPFDVPTLTEAVHRWLDEQDLQLKTIAQPARVALTGRTRSPGIYEVMEALGKEVSLARLRGGADLAEAAAS